MAEHCLMINRFKAKLTVCPAHLFAFPVSGEITASLVLKEKLYSCIFLHIILAPQASDLSRPPGLSLSYNQQSQCRLSHVP